MASNESGNNRIAVTETQAGSRLRRIPQFALLIILFSVLVVFAVQWFVSRSAHERSRAAVETVLGAGIHAEPVKWPALLEKLNGSSRQSTRRLGNSQTGAERVECLVWENHWQTWTLRFGVAADETVVAWDDREEGNGEPVPAIVRVDSDGNVRRKLDVRPEGIRRLSTAQWVKRWNEALTQPVPDSGSRLLVFPCVNAAGKLTATQSLSLS